MGPHDTDPFPSRPLGLLRLAGKLAVVFAVAYAIHMGSDWAMAKAEAAGRGGFMIGLLTVLLLAYAVLIAVPFMPGIEIGISLLILKGVI